MFNDSGTVAEIPSKVFGYNTHSPNDSVTKTVLSWLGVETLPFSPFHSFGQIYSTALLQRAWAEFERSHARDRAALQLQALLDQHTTKLTYTQSTAEVIADRACRT